MPWLWLTTRAKNSRIFQEKSVKDIVTEVLKPYGGESDWRLGSESDYPKLDYCVQHNETDFQFVSRLLEEVGIYYFFEHTDSKHTMVLMTGYQLPLRAIREQIASAVDLIVQQSRLKDGTRKIVNITEVQGMEGDVIVMQDVFVFEQTGIVEGKIQGRLKPTGIRPKFVEKFEVMGIHLPPGLFGFSY